MNWRAHTGVAVRSMIWAYLQAIGFVLFVLLVIALTIDLTDNLDKIQDRAAEHEEPVWQIMVKYLAYRSVDIVTRLLSMATLIGAGVATALRHQRMEDVVLAAAGATPALMFSALLCVGVIFGTLQASFQNWLRPVAVEKQIEMRLGRYGRWFGSTELKGHRWFVWDGVAWRGKITRGSNPGLEDVQIFEGIDQPLLNRIIFADRALPSGPNGEWQLHNVAYWDAETSVGNETTQVETLDVVFKLNIERLQWYGVHAYFIPNRALRQIVDLMGAGAAADGATALAFRKLSFFLPGIFALLGASLAMAGRSGRRFAPFRLLTLATIGYVTLVSVKVFWALGIHGRIAPLPAATIPMSFAFLLAMLLQLQQAGYLKRLTLDLMRE